MRNDGPVFISASKGTYICLWEKTIRFFRCLRIRTGNSDRPGRQQLLSLETNYMDKRHRRASHASSPPVFSKHLPAFGVSTTVCTSPDNDKMDYDSILRLGLTQVNWVHVGRIPVKCLLIVMYRKALKYGT